VREIDRQERVRGRSRQRLSQGDVVVGDTVRRDRLVDILAEEVDRARQPRGGEALCARQGILDPRPADVGPGQPVGDPLPTGEGSNRALPSCARGQCEESATSSDSKGHEA